MWREKNSLLPSTATACGIPKALDFPPRYAPNWPMALAQSLLRLVDVTRRYESPDDTAALTIIEGISLEVASAESVAIVGPSGSGKSTLLHIIGTLDRPTSGAVWLNDQDLRRLNEEQIASV